MWFQYLNKIYNEFSTEDLLTTDAVNFLYDGNEISFYSETVEIIFCLCFFPILKRKWCSFYAVNWQLVLTIYKMKN